MGDDVWEPRLQAGYALTPDRFTIAVGELELDEQFTAILSYDGRFSQPWRRVDISREIRSVGYQHLDGHEGPVPVALGNEGDIYTLLGDQIDWSKIPGAGILSEDADGRGEVYKILISDGRCYVLGRSRQLYSRENLSDWSIISLDTNGIPGYQAEYFGTAELLSDGRIIVVGTRRPSRKDQGLLPEAQGMSEQELIEFFSQNIKERRSTAQPITSLYLTDGNNFSQLEMMSSLRPRSIHQDPMGRIWVVGVDGLILRGRPDDGFERVDFHGDTETLIAATWFQDELIVASGYMLHRFDGHRLTPLKPKLNDPFRNRNTPTPLALQTVGDVMFYFDYKHGVCRWDGETWDWIEFPPGLLDREFKGLTRP